VTTVVNVKTAAGVVETVTVAVCSDHAAVVLKTALGLLLFLRLLLSLLRLLRALLRPLLCLLRLLPSSLDSCHRR
jgi:hypothetical protein